MELGHWAERETGSGRLQNKAGEVWQVWPSSTMGGLKSLWLLTQGVCVGGVVGCSLGGRLGLTFLLGFVALVLADLPLPSCSAQVQETFSVCKIGI